jgi:hypothetical protein
MVRLSDAELAKPFNAQGSNNANAGAEYDEVFATRAEAVEVLRHLAYRFKWLAEIGSYVGVGGIRIVDWVYYYWNENSDWGDVPPPGSGVPLGDLLSVVKYEPLSQRSSS